MLGQKKRELPKTTILFFVGIGLVINEAMPWNRDSVNGLLILAGLGLCGFPISELGDIFFKQNALPRSDSEAAEPKIPPQE